MTRIAFIQNLAYEYLGVMYLSAILKQHGHTVEVFIADRDEDKVLKEILAFQPDLAGFSCTTGIHIWALEFARALKDRLPCHVIFGGPHPTYFPEVITEPAVDIVCRGEGEAAMLEIAEKIGRGKNPADTLNCWVKSGSAIVKNDVRPLIENLDTVPFPDREVYGKYSFIPKTNFNFLASRGCPFDCSFCFNHAFKKLYKKRHMAVRYRSVENVIAEMKSTKEKYRLKRLRLTDDTFILDKKWIREFSREYRDRIGLPFFCTIRADLVNESVIRDLAEAGCRTVGFGVESGRESLRNLLLKKGVTDEQLKLTATLLKKYGIKFRTYNMIGLPGETVADALETVALNTRLGTDYPWCSIFQPYPGTEIADYARKNGFIEGGDIVITPSYFTNNIIKSACKNELDNLHKLFVYAVKFPWTIPLIKKLIRRKPNRLFGLLFLISYGWVVLSVENWTLKEIFSLGRRSLKTMFSSPGANPHPDR